MLEFLKRHPTVWALLFFVGISIVFSWPVLSRLKSGLVTWPPTAVTEFSAFTPITDVYQLYYLQWQFTENVLHGVNPLSNTIEYGPLNPAGTNTLGVWSFPMQLAFLVLSPLGSVVAYNLLTVLSFVITALPTFAVVRMLTGSARAGVLAGLFFAIAPFRLAQMYIGHANGFLFFLLPLMVYCLHRAVSTHSVRWGVGAGLVWSVSVLGEWHLAYYSIFFLAIWLAVFSDWKAHAQAGTMLAGIALGLLPGMVYVFVAQVQRLQDSIASAGRSLTEVAYFSPTASDLVSRGFMHGVFDNEKYVYVGFSVLVLTAAGVGIGIWRRWFTGSTRRTLLFYFGIFIGFTVLGLGLSNGVSAWMYQLFYEAVPFWEYARVPGRMMFLALFALAVLLGFAAKALLRLSGWPTVALVAMGAVILFDLRPVQPNFLPADPGHGPVTQTLQDLAASDQPPTILYLPVYPANDPRNALWEFYSTHWPLPFLNGYSPVAPRTAFAALDRFKAINTGQILPTQTTELRDLGVSYILYDTQNVFNADPATVVHNLNRSPAVQLIAEESGRYLYELDNRELQ